MSLIITSNNRFRQNIGAAVPLNTTPPYSYRNHLRDTFKVPKNSEIALQSVKVEKNGQFILDSGNCIFYHYFGVPLGNPAVRPDFTYATSQPMRGFAGGDEQDFYGGQRVQVNSDDFVRRLQLGMNAVAYHPTFINGGAVGGTEPLSSIVTTVKRDAGLDFKGWNWVATQEVAITQNTTTFNWTDITDDQSGHYTVANGLVTSNDDTGFYVQGRHKPLAPSEGEAWFDFTAAGTDWGVGLSRISKGRGGAGDAGETEFYPTYFDTADGAVDVFSAGAIGQLYGDIMVMRVDNDLRIYQAVCDSGSADVTNGIRSEDDIVMKEIVYWGAQNMNFPLAPLDLSGAHGYTQVRFKLLNEELEIFVWGMAGYVKLTDYTSTIANGGGKANVTFPIHQAKWNLYPVMYASGDGSALTCGQVSTLTNYPVYDENYFWETPYDFWANLEVNGAENHYDVKGNFWNDTAITDGGLNDDGLLAPALTNASQGMADFENILITIPSELYSADYASDNWASSSTRDANTSALFGFIGRGVVKPNTTTDLVCTTFSDDAPKLLSGESLFVRLNNFTQSSINAGTKGGGNITKIIGHLPRFDNAGNETGALFFEPHEKTYIALNNAEDLYINEFDIDIVYQSETLCESLTGTTVVVLHIRQKGTPLISTQPSWQTEM